MSASGAFTQGSRMAAWGEDQYYQPDEWEDLLADAYDDEGDNDE